MAIKRGLGKGMMALVEENEIDRDTIKDATPIDVNKIIPNRYQPRKQFNEERLKELSTSIKEKGVLFPILVSPLGDGRYELVAGERRWRAAKEAELLEIPALIRDFSEEDRLEIALIENIQREDLNAIEVAIAYKEIMEKLNCSQEELAVKVAKSRTAVTNTLRLLKLPDFVQNKVSEGVLSEGHARAILSLGEIDKMLEFAKHIIENNLSVRESEKASRDWKKELKTKDVSRETKKRREAVLDDLEEKFISTLGAKVEILGNVKKGKIQIFYHSEEELENIYRFLKEK